VNRAHRVLAYSLLLAALGCSSQELAGPGQHGDHGGAPDAHTVSCSPTPSSLSTDLFAGACNTSGCHGGSSAAAALDLSREQVAEQLVQRGAGTCDGWLLVAPGDPDASLLVRKLEGNVPEGCGDPMPPTGGLPAELVRCVRDWIAGLDPDAGAPPDPNGCETCGGASCVDLTRDPRHCGGCDVDCGAGGLCEGGACSCAAGYAACASGCAELATDPLNCGSCGTTCGAGQLCTPSGCGNQGDCGGLAVCGSACVDTDTSLSHCGACNTPCQAGQVCSAGSCVCPDGGDLCGGTCVDTQSDSRNCGACGNVCAGGAQCEQGACSCPQLSVDFTSDVAPVLASNCTNAGCHAGNRPKEGLDLSEAKAYAELVNVQADQCNDGRLLVAPGHPEQSYLIQKMLGVNMCSGSQMPKAGVSIPAEDLEAITAWICQGAAK
jgi:hypothetical protein